MWNFINIRCSFIKLGLFYVFKIKSLLLAVYLKILKFRNYLNYMCGSMNCKEFKKKSAFVWWFAVISLTILLDHCIRRALYLPKRALPGKVCLPKEVSTHKFSPLLEETPNKEKKQTYLPRNRQPCEIPVLEMEEIHRELLLERNSVLFSQSEYSKLKQCYPTVIFRGGNSTSASPGDRQVADGLRPVNFCHPVFFLIFPAGTKQVNHDTPNSASVTKGC